MSAAQSTLAGPNAAEAKPVYSAANGNRGRVFINDQEIDAVACSPQAGWVDWIATDDEQHPVIENGDLKIVRSFGRVQFFPEGDV